MTFKVRGPRFSIECLVQGLIETTFVGAHAIKAGLAAEVYRLDSICHGATRFEVAVGRAETILGSAREASGRGASHLVMTVAMS